MFAYDIAHASSSGARLVFGLCPGSVATKLAMRFELEYVEAAHAAQGRRVVVVDAGEITDDIVPDLHEVIVSMCARLYGKRAAKNRAKKAMEAIECE